jgi:integrase
VSKRQRHVPGITVYPRGASWSYRLDLEPDPLTGHRRRENRGGFDTEDVAWAEAIESQRRHKEGRPVAPSRKTVADFMTEWLDAITDALKPSTRQNYADYITAYVRPTIGDRRIQDITVPVLNIMYRHLLTAGRRKVDKNVVMYDYWKARQAERDGLGPNPAEVSKKCGVTIYAARAAVLRYRRGRVPADSGAGLAPKTVKNVHRLLHRAFQDAVAWGYLTLNPAEHASLPREQRRGRTRPKPWTVEELAAWLRVALSDRFAALWLLAATTGMRRSELAGADRDLLVLDVGAGTLTITDTRIVVNGHTVESDGKTESGVRTISLDGFTISLLRNYLASLDREREAFGAGYPTHGKLMRYEDGRPLHADTITRRFNRLVDLAGVRRIRLHDIRHTYATLSLDSGVTPKILSDRIGHSDMSVTFQVYGHHSTGHDREAAELVAKIIREALQVSTEP